MQPYPPEFDGPEICLVCGRHVDSPTTECDCPECPECCEIGNPDCYAERGRCLLDPGDPCGSCGPCTRPHLQPMADSVAAFCEHIGISPLGACLRAIDKHNLEHVWIVLHDGTRLYYEDGDRLDALPTYTRLAALGVGAIPWDGTDAEFSTEVPANDGFAALDATRDEIDDWLAEHNAEAESCNP